MDVCDVCVVPSGQNAKPGQSGQRSTDKVQRTKKIPVGGEIFRTYPDRPWGPPSLLYNGYRVFFPGVKRPGRGVKEIVDLYVFFPSEPSWPVLVRTVFLIYWHICS
jgi:hypothetical protein